jgi:hypothetical protein
MTPGAIIPVVFHTPNMERTEKRKVEAVYDQTVDGTLMPVGFEQAGPILKLLHMPFGQTYVRYTEA